MSFEEIGRGSAWGSPDSREPRSYWQLFSPQTRGPPWEAVTNKPPLCKNETANISLTILNASPLKTMRQKESDGKATSTIDLLANSTWQKVKRITPHCFHLLWIAAICCRWGMVTPLCQANVLQNGLWCHFFFHSSWPIKSLALDYGHGHSDEGRGLGPTCLGNVPVFW